MITNTKSGKQIIRSFTVILDNRGFTVGMETATESSTSEVTKPPTNTPNVTKKN